jgi:hypothetical protein
MAVPNLGSSGSEGSAAIVPAGQEVLHAAIIIRGVRNFRNDRGMLKKDDGEGIDDASTKTLTRPNKLLLTTRDGGVYCDSDNESGDDSGRSIKPTTFTRVNGITSRESRTTAQITTSQSKSRRVKSSYKLEPVKRSNGIDLPYASTIKALKVYHTTHGDLVMPRRYLVPDDPAYPIEWVGVDLASTVYNMKWWQQHVKQKRERVEELNRMEFLWERLQPEWNLVLESLITYSSLKGNVMVPSTFVVPYGDKKWPKATWGIPLGNCVFRIRHRDDFMRDESSNSRRNQLNGLGFVWDVQEHRFQRFYGALRHFARIEHVQSEDASHNTALRVPSTFVVPKNDKAWPKELWGYQLGAKTTAVRQKQLYVKGNPHRQKMLDNLRFQWHDGTGNASLGWLKVMHAAAIYSKMHHRHLDVPFNFKVPYPSKEDPKLRVDTCTAVDDAEDVWPWPEYLWGLPLGQRLRDVRQKGAYLKGKNGEMRRRQLDALGFNWEPQRGRPRKSKTG